MKVDSRRNFIKNVGLFSTALAVAPLVSCGKRVNGSSSGDDDSIPPPPTGNERFFQTRGAILAWEDITSLDWPMLASQAGLTTLSVHTSDTNMQSAAFKKFLKDCQGFNIAVEYEQHAMAELLPRSLFARQPELFRMDEKGNRTADFNCCPSSTEALEIIARNARERALKQQPTTGRYYFWLDDGGKKCHCPDCKEWEDSDQALVIENRIVRELKKLDPGNSLAHLAYQSTMKAPKTVKPEPGIFLEYAPFFRSWSRPLADRNAKREGMTITHGEYIDHLAANLSVFPKDTAQVLEYWLDVSLFSDWKKPAVKLPWNKDVFLSDIDTYAKMGIRHITTFAVYIDGAYEKAHKDLSFIKEYGNGLLNYQG